MLRTVLLIGSGGFIGSVLRYFIQLYFEKGLSSTFPWGTLIANITGSLLIGIFLGLADKGNYLNSEWRMFLVLGFCGGYTTFSSFAYSNFTMLEQKAFSSLLFNIGGNLILGILAVYLGIFLIRLIP